MTITVPPGHRPISGTEQVQPEGARPAGAQDADARITIRVVLRRRTDTGADAEAALASRLRTHPLLREPLTADEFGARFGASADDIDRVSSHLRAGGLTIVETNGPSRTIRATGTSEALGRLFSVELGRYEAPFPASPRRRGGPASTQEYRSHVGPVHVPDDLADLIIGVFGLDNRRISLRNSAGDPPGTTTTTVPEIASRYNFPTNSAAGQTIAIFAADDGSLGFAQSDIDAYYAHLPAGYTAPTPLTPNVDGTTNDPGNPDPEATQDICIASTVAQGAAIAVYLNEGGTNGWLAVLDKVTFPTGSEPRPSVLSSSFYLANGDDASALASAGITTSFLTALSGKFADAGAQGVTVCIASGDTGAESKIADGTAHVQYPGSDPNVLACGGTTVGSNPKGPVEWVWNDVAVIDGEEFPSATGGGVSAFFALPSWQSNHVSVPAPLQAGRIIGRGVPDVAGNASWNSGYYPMYTIGMDPNPWNGNGTSAVAPLYAGLFAVINAALGFRVGFINPTLYELGATACTDINPAVVGGPADNSLDGTVGYPAGPGWDACTGWGTINGIALLTGIRRLCAAAANAILQALGEDNEAVRAKAAQLRRLRDEQLPLTVAGPEFAELLGEDAVALGRAILSDPTAHALAVDAIAPWAGHPTNAELLAATIEDGHVARMESLVDCLSRAVPEQAAAMWSLQALLADSVGLTVSQMLGREVRQPS